MQLRKYNLYFLSILLVFGILIGIVVDRTFFFDILGNNSDKVKDILKLTDKYYIEDLDQEVLVESAITGILNKLDPHSVYISQKENEEIEDSFRGDFIGIGIEYQVIEDTLNVISPITGGPSELLGVLPGDKIVKVNGKIIVGASNEIIRNNLRGKEGTNVKLSIARPGYSNFLEIDVKRSKIPLYTVESYFMLNKETGFISVSRFSEKTEEEFIQALKELESSGMKQLLVDLRGNPGGYLDQAVNLVSLFLDKNKKIVFTRGRVDSFNQNYYAPKSSKYAKLPLVVLVDGGSASASEIFAGAIQDWDRGLIVGNTTFGKGLVQRNYELSDHSVIRLTISKYFTPSGRSIQKDYKNLKWKEKYFSDLEKKNDSKVDNINHNSESDSTKKVYKTSNGRKIYGEGGITPDYFVKSEVFSELSATLLKSDLFFQFTSNYLASNNEFIKKYPALESLINNFQFSKKDLDDFKFFIKNKNIYMSNSQYLADKMFILKMLKASIARYYWKNKGWYRVLFQSDSQVAKAIGLFNNAKQISGLK